jgi:hypothetical protein
MPAVERHRVTVGANNVIGVHVSAATLFNLEKLTAIQKTVLGQLGHQGCCSGYIIGFQLDEQQYGK